MYSAHNTDKSHVIRGLASLKEASDDYIKAEDYYTGEVKEIFGNSTVARHLAKTSEGFEIRFSALPVDAVLDRLEVSAIKVPDAESAEEQVAKIRRANRLDIAENEIHKNVCVYGDAYVLAIGVDADDESETKAIRECGVKVSLQSVFTTRAVYDDDTSDPAFVIRTFQVGEYKFVEVWYPDGTGARYQSKNKSLPEDSYSLDENDWHLYVEEGLEVPDGGTPGVIDLGVPGLPITHFRNAFPYGKPEHIEAYGPQNHINKYLASATAVSTSLVYPQRYGIIEPRVATQVAQSNGYNDPDDEPEDIDPLFSQAEGQTDNPAYVQIYEGFKALGSWETAEPDKFLGPIKYFLDWMYDVTSTPNPAASTGSNLSGVSRQTLDQRFTKKVEKRQLWIGGYWGDVWVYALSLVSVTVEDAVIEWSPAGIATDKETIDTLISKRNAGVPDSQILSEMGYTQDQVKEFLEEKSDEISAAYRAEVIIKVAPALEAMKPLLSDEEFTELKNKLLGEVTGMTFTTPTEEEPAAPDPTALAPTDEVVTENPVADVEDPLAEQPE